MTDRLDKLERTLGATQDRVDLIIIRSFFAPGEDVPRAVAMILRGLDGTESVQQEDGESHEAFTVRAEAAAETWRKGNGQCS